MLWVEQQPRQPIEAQHAHSAISMVHNRLVDLAPGFLDQDEINIINAKDEDLKKLELNVNCAAVL